MNVNIVHEEIVPRPAAPAELTEFEIYEIELYARDRLANDKWPPRGQVLRVLQNIIRLCNEVQAGG